MNQYKIKVIRDLVSDNKKLLSEIQFHKKIFRNLSIAVYIYDIAERKHIWINNHYSNIVGYAQKEIKEMGSDWFLNRIHPDDINIIDDRVYFLTKEKGNSYSGIYRLKHKTGKWIWCYSNCVVYKRDETGFPSQLLGIAIDFSDNFKTIKQFSELNKENQRLKNRINISKLTKREKEITKHISTGKSTTEIANFLNISEHTVNNHRKSILRKLDFHNIAELVRFAVETGIN